MTRDEFTAGYVQRMRNVIQKQSRLVTVRQMMSIASSDDATVSLPYTQAQSALDATLQELADYVFDAVEAVHAA